jgi:hypothetical protein
MPLKQLLLDGNNEENPEDFLKKLKNSQINLPGKPSNEFFSQQINLPIQGQRPGLPQEIPLQAQGSYKSTYPATPYAPDYDPSADIANPNFVDVAVDEKRQKLLNSLKSKKSAAHNNGINPDLPKKFTPNQKKRQMEAEAANRPPTQLPKVPKSSKIRDENNSSLLPKPASFDDGVGSSFGLMGEREPYNLGLQVPEYTNNMSPILGGYDKPVSEYAPESLAADVGRSSPTVSEYLPNKPNMNTPPSLPADEGSGEDFRSKLYEYLKNKMNGQATYADRLKRMGAARDANATNQFGALLAGTSSKMGTLQGKRADVADFQPLIRSIYDRDMGSVQDEMALENEREDSLLKGASLSSKILKSTGPKPPKILPYYKPSTSESPGEILMYDEAGNLMPRQLPAGYEPNNPWSTLPTFIDAQGKPVVIQQNPVTGQTRQLPIPNNLRSLEQAKMEANNILKKIDLDIKVAGEQRRGELMREQVRYQQYLSQLRQKEFELRLKEQNERERTNRAREGIQKDKIESGTGKYGGNLTEAERKTGLQATVAIPALAQLEAMENGDKERGMKPYRPGARSIIGAGLGGTTSPVGNKILSDDDRLYDTASNNLVEMLLRSVTGAGAQKEEIKRIMAGYRIMAGDDERTIKYKQEARRSFVQGLIDASGRAGKGKSLPPQSSSRTIIDEKYSPSRNKTIIIYSDGTKQTLQGRRNDGQPKR